MSTTESPDNRHHGINTRGISSASRSQRGPSARTGAAAAGQLVVHTPDGRHLSFGRASTDGSAAATSGHCRLAGLRQRFPSGGDIGFAEALRDGWVDSADLTALLRLGDR